MAKAPWFPFYTGDFLASTDVQLMEAHEVGAYLLLLAHSWQSDTPGFLPNDEGRLRRLARLSAEQWKDSRELLLSKWPEAAEDASLRSNPRLVKEAGKQVEMRELKAEAGRKSAERRARLATEGQQSGNTISTPVGIPATGVGEKSNYSQPQSQPQSQEGKPSSSLRSEDAAPAAASEPEKKIGPESPPENPAADASHTRGAADVGTRKGKSRPSPKLLLAESPVATLEAFADAWKAAAAANPATYADFAAADLKYYHGALGDWSRAGNNRKADWLATILGSMRRDAADGRLRTTTPFTQPSIFNRNAPHQRPSAYANPNSAASRLQVQQPTAEAGWGYPGGNRSPAPTCIAGESL